MPKITDWFDAPIALPWVEMNESFYSDKQGIKFFTYPLYWLIPFINLSDDDLKDSAAPLWIPDVSTESRIGKVNNEQEGTYLIDLPDSFGKYFDSLLGRHKKKFRAVLEKNSDIQYRVDNFADIDTLWPHYVERLKILTSNEGAEDYTEEELSFRRKLYSSKNISTLSFYKDTSLYAVNVSYWKEGRVFDLACMINPIPEALQRSFGTLAILKNIEFAIERKIECYDLLTRDYGYKKSYGATEVKLKHYIKCDRKFAEFYGIDIESVSELL